MLQVEQMIYKILNELCAHRELWFAFAVFIFLYYISYILMTFYIYAYAYINAKIYRRGNQYIYFNDFSILNL